LLGRRLNRLRFEANASARCRFDSHAGLSSPNDFSRSIVERSVSEEIDKSFEAWDIEIVPLCAEI
jgi:hypothetical protein